MTDEEIESYNNQKFCHIYKKKFHDVDNSNYGSDSDINDNSDGEEFDARKFQVMFFFIVRNCSFFMGIIFCSSVASVWIFNNRGVYNFVSKKGNILVNLVPFFNDFSFLLCHFLKSGVTNELQSLFLLKSKKVTVIYSKQDKTLLLVKR